MNLQPLLATYQQQEQLTAQRQQLEKELFPLGDEINRCYSAISHARNTLNGHKNATDPRLKALAEQQQQELQRLEQEAQRLTQQKQTLTQSIEQIDQTLASLSPSVSTDHLHAYHHELTARKAQVQTLQELIEQQQAIIHTTAVHHDELARLQRQREDLLADIAQGKASDKDLKPIDDQLSALKQKHQADQTEQNAKAEEARQILAGLLRKMDAATTDLATFETFQVKLLDGFLMTKGQALLSTYRQQAADLTASLAQLMALESLIQGFGQRKGSALMSNWARDSKLYDGIDPSAPEIQNRPLLNGETLREALADAMQQERAQLQAAGLSIA